MDPELEKLLARRFGYNLTAPNLGGMQTLPVPTAVPAANPASRGRSNTAVNPAQDLTTLINNAAVSAGVDPVLFRNLIQAESNFNPNATSPRGAMGLGQVMPDTARAPGYGIAPLTNPYDPAESLRFSAQYLAAMLGQTGGNVQQALAAYNWGPGNVQNWVARGANENALPAETRAHIAKILGEGLPAGQSNYASNQAGLITPPQAPVPEAPKSPTENFIPQAVNPLPAATARTMNVADVQTPGNIEQPVTFNQTRGQFIAGLVNNLAHSNPFLQSVTEMAAAIGGDTTGGRMAQAATRFFEGRNEADVMADLLGGKPASEVFASREFAALSPEAKARVTEAGQVERRTQVAERGAATEEARTEIERTRSETERMALESTNERFAQELQLSYDQLRSQETQEGLNRSLRAEIANLEATLTREGYDAAYAREMASARLSGLFSLRVAETQTEGRNYAMEQAGSMASLYSRQLESIDSQIAQLTTDANSLGMRGMDTSTITNQITSLRTQAEGVREVMNRATRAAFEAGGIDTTDLFKPTPEPGRTSGRTGRGVRWEVVGGGNR